MTTELNAIERSCAKYGGGLKSLALVDPADLDSQPSWYILPNIASLDFGAGKAAYVFSHDRLQGSLTGDTDTSNPGGDVFTYRLSAFIRHLRGEGDLLRNKLRNRRVHVLGTYFDGSQRFVPNMRLSAADQSGDRAGAKQGYAFTGVARLNSAAPWLQGSFDVIGGPYVPPAVPSGDGGVSIIEIATSDPTYTYNILAGYWLVGWEITGNTAQSVSLGTTALGSELGGPIDLDIGQTWVGQANMLPTGSATNIYFSGLEGANEIKLWLLG